MEASKKSSIDELPREDIVKKYKKLLLLAQNAKEAKNECLEELKLSREKEQKLTCELTALQEVLKSLSEKQKDAAEAQNNLKLVQTQNEKYVKQIEKLEASLSDKEHQNIAMQETLKKFNEKLSAFEIQASEDKERIIYLEKKIEIPEVKESDTELNYKLKLAEEKYALLDKKLVEFQDKYIEEKKKHSKLEALLGKLEESRSEKSGSERSESRDGLHTVAETDLETVCQKMDEAVESSERLKAMNEELRNLNKSLKKELDEANNSIKHMRNSHRSFIDNMLQHCQALEKSSSQLATEYFTFEEKHTHLQEDLISHLSIQNELKDARESLNNLSHINTKEEELELKVQNLESELADCKEKLAEAEGLLVEENEKFSSSTKEVETLKRNLRIIQEEVEALKERKDEKTVIENLNKEILVLREENVLADNKLKEVQSLLAESNCRLEEVTLTENKEEYEHLKEKVQTFDNLVPQLQRLWKDVTNTKLALSTMKSKVLTEVVCLHKDHSGISGHLSHVVSDFVLRLSENNSALLTEMNIMNQALKDRGEAISQLEEVAATLRADAFEDEKRLKKTLEKLEQSEQEITTLRGQLEARDKTVREMEEEIWRLRGSDSPADALSSSTISKVEESQRLMDLEESFEEKYNKLKILAVKMKKKVIELQTQLDQERAKLTGERAEFQTKLTSFQTQMKTFNTLQAEYDALQDKCTAERREAADLRKSMNKLREENLQLKQSCEEWKGDKSKFKQEKETFDMIKKELTGQINSLKKALEKEQGKVKDWDVERSRREQELKALEKKLEEEKERHKVTIASLEEERHKQKKQRVLSLEMAEYERTGTELSRKLETKELQIRELTASLDTQRELIETLQATSADLEARVVQERSAADAAKQRQDAIQEEITALRAELSSKMAMVAQVDRLAQERAQQLEEIKLDMSAVTADYNKREEAARVKILGLEDLRTQLQTTVERRELELDELKKDFESYKVRAQSVLRQSQREGPLGRQLDIEQEVVQLRASCDTLKLKLEEATRRLQILTEEHNLATSEKARLTSKVQELQAEVTLLNTMNVQLQEAEQRLREQNEEAARLLPLQQETLAQCYRREIEDLEEKYKREVEAARLAQQQAETALHLHLGRQTSPTHRRQPSTGVDASYRRQPSTGTTESTHRRQPSTGFVPVKSERETLDVLMLEREACEGSESVDSTSPRVLPLEQLLAPQAPTINMDASQWAERLEKCESQIQHLTTLLSDAEGDAARLQQLNQVLKEEIRRKERNVAREEHAGNLEYLKNVVVKFATLPRGDERLRLVPVLNTILKLSREEEQRLSVAARGDSGASGWGSYLGGMWAASQ